MKILFFISLFLVLPIVAVNACTTDADCTTSGQTCVSSKCVSSGATTKDSGGTVSLTDPLNGVTPQTLIGKIIKGVFGLVGSLALAMFVYGGFTWMLAAGNSTNVEKGKQILIWATIGLIVIFSSYALVQFVFKDVLGVT